MTEKEAENNNIKTWETPYRKDGLKESVGAFESFLVFRDMGLQRSLKKTAEITGKQ